MTSVLQLPAASASAPTLRQFPFFNPTPVNDLHEPSEPPDVFKITPEISAFVSSSAGPLLADMHGSMHILNKNFEIAASWIAHADGRVTHMAERNGVLVTFGEEQGVISPLLKIWDLHKFDKATGIPLLLRSVKVNTNNKPHPITCVTLSRTLSHLAIGLGDGTILLYRNLDQSLASSNSLTSMPKLRTIQESPAEPITGLGFKEPSEDQPNLHLFVTTTNRVLSYQATGKGHGGSATVVDEVGCGLGCAAMDQKSKEIIVARDEAIYLCGIDGRGSCLAYEGHKSQLQAHQNYIVLVSPPFVARASAASATVRHFARSAESESDITKVTIIDMENKLIGFSVAFKEGVKAVISQWGCIYVLSSDGKLTCLQETPNSQKLEMLYSRSLYVIALNLAKTQKMDEHSLADIRRQYGDHLYSNGDYDGAMHQYILTIGQVQPSYVIRKYLDAQRIHGLVTYLQELHSLGLANADHTTLLLNTYTKLKDVSRLDTFIKTEARRTMLRADGEEVEELPFDLETAIRVCRQAGYFDHASYLALKYERHEDYLRIQIEDQQNFKDALAYLRKLGAEAAESNLARYGRAMLETLPDDTTQLLIDLCTDPSSLLQVSSSSESPSAIAKQTSSGPSYLSYLALNRHIPAAPTLTSSDGATITGASTKTAVARSLHRDSVHEPSPPESPPRAPSPPPSVKRLSPRIYFAHFVDHYDQFVTFLETVAWRRWGQTVDEHPAQQKPVVKGPPEDVEADALDQVAVWNTLLELYLSPHLRRNHSSTAATEEQLRKKAQRLLSDAQIPYNETHALIVCSSKSYTEGLVLLWEKMGMYEDIIHFWMDRHKASGDPTASGEVIRHLNIHGANRPYLYPLVLRFLTSSPNVLAKHQDDIKSVIQHIDESGLMSPLAIVQALSWNGVASMGLVKQWLMKKITTSRSEISKDHDITEAYRGETAEKLRQVDQLADPTHPHVFQVTRCSSCEGQLDLPSIHFMCDHSYHQRCLTNRETECPRCARQHGIIREIRQNNERLADQHELFASEVREGGFGAVAVAFGRGALNSMPRAPSKSSALV